MTGYGKKLAACGLATIFLASVLATAAYAQTSYVDPNALGPQARARALHGPLGDRDPWGRPAAANCTWSRIQVPTSEGLRWMAMQECDPDSWH
jgi:hypothetical protein